MIPVNNKSALHGGPKTFETEKMLPKLPVPKLEHTMKQLIDNVQPYCSNIQLEAVKKKVEEALQPESNARKAQRILLDRREKTNNYIDEWWTNYAYLKFQDALPPVEGMSFEFPPYIQLNQIERASYLVRALLKFYSLLLTENLSVMGTPEAPMSMHQYRNLIKAHRVPGVGQDKQINTWGSTDNYAVVVCNSKFFRVDLLNASGAWLTLDEIYTQLSYISDNSKSGATPIGYLTTLPRTEWYVIRENLKASSVQNQECFKTIEGAMFVLCLDPSTPDSKIAKMREVAIGANGGCRYYDHTCQWIVFANGKIGYTFEHSQMDAIPSFRMLEDLYTMLHQTMITRISLSKIHQSREPKELQFQVNHDIKQECQRAKVLYDKIREDWQIEIKRSYCASKTLLKQYNMSPNSFMQMAFQVAYYRLYQRTPSTYEAVATVKFQKGRTETGRPVTLESVALAKGMFLYDSSKATSQEKVKLLQLLKQAMAAHQVKVKAAANGMGMDRHLFALQIQCTELGIDIPRILVDDCVVRSSKWDLSTSHVVAPLAMQNDDNNGVSFHPVGAHSTGLVFGIYDDFVDLTVMNNASGNLKSGVVFIEAVESAVEDLLSLENFTSKI